MNAQATNPREAIGGNNPPEPTPFEAISAHVADLLEEARNFLDGEPITTQGQANDVSRLMDDARKTSKLADAERAMEKKPHDDAAKAVQAKWKPLIDGTDKAVTVCKQALQPFLIAQEAEKRRIADEARAEAQRKAEEAAKALREAADTDLAAQEAAEALVKDAKKAETAANRAAGDRGRATGGSRATSLRDSWAPVLVDGREALRHYWITNPKALEDFALGLARQDVLAGKRSIPGFEVVNTPVVV